MVQSITIHLLSVDEEPAPNSVVTANCDKELVFREPIEVMWFEDSRVCPGCLNNRAKPSKKIFAFVEETEIIE